MTPKRQESHISKAADFHSNMRKQCGQNITPALNNSTVDNNREVFNIQLNYNINEALDPESWDSEFRAVSLYKSIEHLASAIKNIKESLQRMQRYILDKAIDSNKANDIKNLKGIDKVAWGFISVFYDSHWDNLIVDGTNRLFRNNVKSKFSPQAIKKPTNPKGKNTKNLSYVSSLSLPILAKTIKEVNEILKYFKIKFY